ncbi:MAG: DNA-binding protein WhiA [Clostridia bacterium]
MSFSSRTKDEAVKQRVKSRGERLALLCALTHAAGSISLSRSDGVGIRYVTENLNVARLTAQLSVELYDVVSSIAVSEHEGLKARNTIVKLTGESCKAILTDSGCLSKDDGDNISTGIIPQMIITGEADRRAFVKGVFLGCGSVTDPRKGYHLELVCRNEGFAQALEALINTFDLSAKITARKNSYAVYIKDGDAVSDFLTLIGAMNSTMEFEHVRILRGVTNNLNRQSNFENANMQKTALASAQQLVDIELIRLESGLDTLPPKLRDTAEVRINNPEASLSELADILEISRSGINHRLTKLSEMAMELRIEKGKSI